jgi:signal transduction histidine kinase
LTNTVTLMLIKRVQAWLGYGSVWLTLGLFYSMIMAETQSVPAAQSLVEGFSYVVPAALLGAVVWYLTGVIEWPTRNRFWFVALHAFCAIGLAAIWLGTEISAIAIPVGFVQALVIAKSFAGFQALDGIFVYGIIASGSYVIRIATRLREQEARVAQADMLRMRAELSALRGQLNPHFLFNTLHTLTALVRRDPDTAENALQQYGDMLRYVLDVKRSDREDVTLGDELRFVRNYLSLEQLRLGERLNVVEAIDPETLDCVVPSLTLQPLVENAIKYGIAPRASVGTLTLAASFDDDALVLEVRDDGPGARGETLDHAGGVGLRAVRQRLETRYAGSASFTVTTAPLNGFAVRLQLPIESTRMMATSA